MEQYQSEFIELFTPLIASEMKRYSFGNGAVILAQAILESGWGRSNLAKKNNFFGMKAPSSYNGETQNGFMIYSSPVEAVNAYFELMMKPRYAGLKGITDCESYIDELIRSGYCDDKGYKEQLLQLIDKYELLSLFSSPISFELIERVVNGDYGNGEERRKKLLSEGYDPEYVRALVNFYLKHEAKLVPCLDAFYKFMTGYVGLIGDLSMDLDEPEVELMKDLMEYKAAPLWDAWETQ